ncbi:hypothetical protein GPA10_11160 [Streptomyces sp. p1417]|uniref:Peptidase inhibitor family I36 n=1 Tax=Streptomyces typhae TaxID=2681492 RepID=A0A6L6WWZ0_9ACTN|nr:hypothetical protein [Streptomyces typhae]MVO85296.1 hypothetical protein [Streptomyces typhae]
MIKKTVAAALSAGVLATGGALIAAAPAQASACPSGRLCAYVVEQPSSANAYNSRTWTGAPGTVSGLNPGSGWKSIDGSALWRNVASNQWIR